MTTIYINTDDRNWGQDGAIFDDYDAAEKCAEALAETFDCSAAQILDTLEAVTVEEADASQIEDIEREIRMLGPLSPATMAAIAAKKLQTHDDE